jgi:hypothetical protein
VLAEIGEPWKSFMQPEPLGEQLMSLGFSSVEDLGGDEINERYLANRRDGLEARGIGRIAIARKASPNSVTNELQRTARRRQRQRRVR